MKKSQQQFSPLVIELILVAVPEGTANRQILGISYIATQTRKSLVKGERFIRCCVDGRDDVRDLLHQQ